MDRPAIASQRFPRGPVSALAALLARCVSACAPIDMYTGAVVSVSHHRILEADVKEDEDVT